MRCRFLMTAFALTTGLICFSGPLLAQTPSTYKVLATGKSGFNVSAIESLLRKGDDSVSRGDLREAKEHFLMARNTAQKLAPLFRNLSGSFRGLDARIPREMDAKGRKALMLHAKANLRLAALFRRQNKPEEAVPLLVEVVKITTPAKKEGQKAYQSLVELGFVETPYLGAR